MLDNENLISLSFLGKPPQTGRTPESNPFHNFQEDTLKKKKNYKNLLWKIMNFISGKEKNL